MSSFMCSVPGSRTVIILLVLLGVVHCVDGQEPRQAEDAFMAARVSDPDSILLARVVLALPMKDDSISEDARRKLDAKMSAADDQIQALHKKVGKDEASKKQFAAAAQKIHETLAKDTNELTEKQRQSLNDRQFVVTGEVLGLQENPLDFLEQFPKLVKPSNVQIQPLLKDAAEEFKKLKAREEAGTDTAEDWQRQSRLCLETLLKLHQLLTPAEGMNLIALVMPGAGQTPPPTSQP